ncbi:MAG TPA: PQQ-binding-like beta-propeller repeat protein [Vicinamibacterales bacterium]|nr:PQQ-binding-like beta-propeller repeat protein [Vicinamibacterales bacterium]
MTRAAAVTLLAVPFAVVSASLAAGPTPSAPGSVADPSAWGQWRGPLATGVGPKADPPIEWSETKNVRWKVEVPGRGSGTPVVWGDRVFLLTAIPSGRTGAASHEPQGGKSPRDPHQFKLLAYDRKTGTLAWERTAREEAPHEASHQDNGTWASSSAITDGEHVIAYFESRGIHVFDMNGTKVWDKDLGDKGMRNEFGEGSTPVLFGNTLVIVWDHIKGPSFIVALDKRTGKELWRTSRDEIDTWATPLVVPVGGRHQVIVPAMNKVRGYDLETGKMVWEAPGTTMNAIPSPVYGAGLVFLMSGFRGNNLKAIRLAGATGDLTGTGAIVWELNRDTPYVPSPLLYDNILYFLKTNNGLLSAFDAASGKPHYQLQRLDKAPNVFSSPVGASGRVYIAGREGTTVVFRHGPKFDVLAANVLDDGFDASPALVDREIFLRGYSNLYCIAAGS